MYLFLSNLVLYILPHFIFTHLLSVNDVKYQSLYDHLPEDIAKIVIAFDEDVGYDDYDPRDPYDERHPCECDDITIFGRTSRFCKYAVFLTNTSYIFIECFLFF